MKDYINTIIPIAVGMVFVIYVTIYIMTGVNPVLQRMTDVLIGTLVIWLLINIFYFFKEQFTDQKGEGDE